jgi:hypothetical protein
MPEMIHIIASALVSGGKKAPAVAGAVLWYMSNAASYPRIGTSWRQQCSLQHRITTVNQYGLHDVCGHHLTYTTIFVFAAVPCGRLALT